MVNRPQCFGTVCALGSAYRQQEWLEPCGNICQQVIVGNGEEFRQTGMQTLSCGGDIYNVGNTNEPAGTNLDLTALFVVFGVVVTLAAVFLVLFAIFAARSKRLEQDSPPLVSRQ